MLRITKIHTIVSLFLILSFTNTYAESLATIEALQIPVFIERDNKRIAAIPGLKLIASDRIVTGNNSRVLMRLADNSTVKLGENVEFELDQDPSLPSDDTTFRAALNVLKGAFRFTTGIVNKFTQREIKANIKTVTIGIRGTDVWGKSEPERDFVVLLEGNIDIQRNNEPAVNMSEPLSLFMAPRNQPAEPIKPVNPDDLAIWAQETELQAGQGIINNDGGYALNLISHEDLNAAELSKQNLVNQGYPVIINELTINGKTWYRVSMEGISSFGDAQSLLATTTNQLGYDGIWISRK